MDEKHSFKKALGVAGFWLVALLWGDEAKVRMGESIWLPLIWVLAGASIVLVAPYAIYQTRRAYQHKYGGRAQTELYTPGHIPIRGWRRAWTRISPYIIGGALLLLAGWIGWFVIEAAKAYGSLPITFAAGGLTRAPGPKWPEFREWPEWPGIAEEIVVLGECTIVNHAKSNMSLQFYVLARIANQDEDFSAMMVDGVWRRKFEDKEEAKVINLPGKSTVTGTLIFRLPPIFQRKTLNKAWKDIETDKFLLMIEDKISGRIIQCAMLYYKPGLEQRFSDIDME